MCQKGHLESNMPNGWVISVDGANSIVVRKKKPFRTRIDGSNCSPTFIVRKQLLSESNVETIREWEKKNYEK